MIRSTLLILVLGLSITACGDDTSGSGADAMTSVCATSTLTYANFAEGFVTSFCKECHSSASGNRNGAPTNINFDMESELQSLSANMKARAGTSESMPIAAAAAIPTAADRFKLVEWVDCGTK